jgi:hypothetical protein
VRTLTAAELNDAFAGLAAGLSVNASLPAYFLVIDDAEREETVVIGNVLGKENVLVMLRRAVAWVVGQEGIREAELHEWIAKRAPHIPSGGGQ